MKKHMQPIFKTLLQNFTCYRTVSVGLCSVRRLSLKTQEKKNCHCSYGQLLKIKVIARISFWGAVVDQQDYEF